MNEHSVTHATFTLERTYPASPQRVFAAWADPASKARWFANGAEHTLDFRVGGREVLHAERPDGPTLTFDSLYQDIITDERIVYAATLLAGETRSTLSLTTVQFTADGTGTRLVLTEQGAYLDGQEQPSWREQGTSDWLAALAKEF